MATAWITYAWKDNEDQMIEFVAQELGAAGLDVKLDRWDSYLAGTTFARHTWSTSVSRVTEKVTHGRMGTGWKRTRLRTTPTPHPTEVCRREYR
jgi:hypothetical protein